MYEKLLPCPFCGGEADIEEIPGSPFTNEPYTWAVGCNSCNIGWYEETQAEATSKWNRRAQPENEPLTCEGCVDKGQYENEVEYGYPSPCTRCKRRSPDNYRRKPEEEV